MLSQFRNAVEQFANQQTSPTKHTASDDTSSRDGTVPRVERDTQKSPANSLDEGRRSLNLASPGQLAESALLNFKKNLISSRSSSPYPSQAQATDKENGRHGRSLEERLHASFTLGDASEQTTPVLSRIPTPPNGIDPASVELPQSPEKDSPASWLGGAFDPLGAQLSPDPSQVAGSSTPIHVDFVRQQSDTSPTGKDIINTQASPGALLSQPPPPGFSSAPSQALNVQNQHPSISSVNDDSAPNVVNSESSPLQNASRPATPRPLSPFLAEDRDVDRLRERLKLVEQRFTDVSTSFKRLQAEKRAADRVLKDLTPLESISDVEALRDHLKNLAMKTEMSAEEIKRLNGKIQQHDIRLEELRGTHRLEAASQSDQIERLQKQVSEAEALLKAGMDESIRQKADTEQLRAEMERAKGVAKEEEEKTNKAISLLKTVRAKLVKVEKEKDETLKEVAVLKEKEKEEREKIQLERSRLELELERSRLEREREVAALRTQFESEQAATKDKLEKEYAARKAQFELEAITTKAAHGKEIVAKTSRITSLESNIRVLSQEKDSMFDQLQMRQAEAESSQSYLDSVEARSKELQYRLREAEDRIEVLTEDLNESNRKMTSGQFLGGSYTSADEVARLLSDTEGKYESRIGDLRTKLRGLERERHEAEEEWSRNLQERGRELERLRGIVSEKDREYAESVRSKSAMEARLSELEAENRRLRGQIEAEHGILLGLQKDIAWLKEVETSTKEERDQALLRSSSLEAQVSALLDRESALKLSNKTLREELRKVQSSAALLERQRNPGIGYWGHSSRSSGFTQSAIDLQTIAQPTRNSVDEGSTASSPRPTSPTISGEKRDEEVSLEYLRNVILQFLEHKDMRPNLVRVLSVILHFTPQETRRLIAKV